MELAEVLIILSGSLLVTGFARWRGLPAPLLTVAVALAVSFLPGVPDIDIQTVRARSNCPRPTSRST